VWMPKYTLMRRGETLDNDEKAASGMLPYIWLLGKNKSLAAARNRAKNALFTWRLCFDAPFENGHFNPTNPETIGTRTVPYKYAGARIK
jgi:hypothetical protein